VTSIVNLVNFGVHRLALRHTCRISTNRPACASDYADGLSSWGTLERWEQLIRQTLDKHLDLDGFCCCGQLRAGDECDNVVMQLFAALVG
jgi:hypothetical protein